jgi:P27 family predicted phage terminase small subunit
MKLEKSHPAPPKHLSPAARRLWRSLTAEFVIADAAGLAILTAGLESFDRAAAAKALLDKDGPVFRDRYDQPRAHPAAAVERDSRAAWMSSLKQLNLDCIPARPGPGRPGGGV